MATRSPVTTALVCARFVPEALQNARLRLSRAIYSAPCWERGLPVPRSSWESTSLRNEHIFDAADPPLFEPTVVPMAETSNLKEHATSDATVRTPVARVSLCKRTAFRENPDRFVAERASAGLVPPVREDESLAKRLPSAFGTYRARPQRDSFLGGWKQHLSHDADLYSCCTLAIVLV